MRFWAVLALGLGMYPAHADDAVGQSISFPVVIGGVMVRHSGGQEWVEIHEGDAFTQLDEVKTLEDGKTTMRLNGSEVMLLPNTALSVDEAVEGADRTSVLLNLQLGSIRAGVETLNDASRFEVSTPTAVAAVRGTVLYLDVQALASDLADFVTELFVEEGKVGFTPVLDKLNELIVDQLGLSVIGSSGSVSPLTHLSADAAGEFISHFLAQFDDGSGNPQFAVEEGVIPGGSGPGFSGGILGIDFFDNPADLAEALKDIISGLSTDSDVTPPFADTFPGAQANRTAINALLEAAGALQIHAEGTVNGAFQTSMDAELLSEGVENAGEWSFELASLNFDQGIVTDERVAPLRNIHDAFLDIQSQSDGINTKIGSLTDLSAQAQGTEDNGELLVQARTAAAMAQGSFDQIVNDQTVIDGNFAVLQNLRARERDLLKQALESTMSNQMDLRFQAAIERQTDAQTGKVFTDIHGNRVRTDQYIDQPGDNAVRVTSLTYRAAGPLRGVSALVLDVVFNTSITGSLRDLPWDSFLNVVTHVQIEDYLSQLSEWNDSEYELPEQIAYADEFIVHEYAENRPALYPVVFSADFRNPDQDRVLFQEFYSAPMAVITGAVIDEDVLWVQGLMWDRMDIFLKGSDESIVAHFKGFDAVRPGEFSDDDGFGGFTDDEHGETHPQSETVDLGRFNPLEPANHPAFILEHVDVILDEGIKSMYLLGQFIPFDNQGNIFDGEDHEGFAINGLRDIVAPNRLVNGGDYNLEIILQLGTVKEGEDTEFFDPLFTIDTLITPEIFRPYGTRTPERSIFQDRLNDFEYD